MIAFIHHHSSCISICFILIYNINAKSTFANTYTPSFQKRQPLHVCCIMFFHFFQPWLLFRTNSLVSSSSKILPSASQEKRSPSWWTMCSVALGVALGHACDLAFVECWYNIPITSYNPEEGVETRNDSKIF